MKFRRGISRKSHHSVPLFPKLVTSLELSCADSSFQNTLGSERESRVSTNLLSSGECETGDHGWVTSCELSIPFDPSETFEIIDLARLGSSDRVKFIYVGGYDNCGGAFRAAFLVS
jgi:hypothetical protein